MMAIGMALRGFRASSPVIKIKCTRIILKRNSKV